MVSYSFEGNKRLWTARDDEENAKIFSQQSKPTGVKIPLDIRPTYLANAQYDAEKWPLIHLMRLLRFYAAHRCLWDVGCKDNRNRKMRQAAIADITGALNTGVNKEKVVQKINILRNTYRYEKKRIKQRIRRGLGARTKLKWFALADAFLRNVPKKGQKEEDPSNSDSDLEDTIVFTINPESLMPLDEEVSTETFLGYHDNVEQTSQTKLEIFSDDSHYDAGGEIELMHDSSISNKKPFAIELERNANHQHHYSKYAAKKKTWTFKDTLRFLQLLEKNSVVLENSMETCALHQVILESIAKEMKRPHKHIEKRWFILQKVCKEENLKILQNPQYKPKYKWWPETEKLFLIKSKNDDNSIMHGKDVPTESIFLTENENQQSNDSEEYENRFLQNPIPSVAPLSNMNEAMESLFHAKNDCESFSQESNTNSSFHKENDSSNSGKFVWHGLEDDLLEGKWSLKHSVKFLRLYGVHSCLWNLKDPDYRSRPLRNAAMEDIAASMGYGLTASYVAKKIKIFRITYMQQRKRLLEATEKGEKPEILLKWFPLADSFLRPHIGLRSIKSDAKEIPQFDYQYVYANLNLIDPALLNDFRGKGTQNAIEIGIDSELVDMVGE